MAPQTALVPGMMLGGRYVIDALAHTGNTAEVWTGTDVLLDRAISVKTLRPEAARHPAAVEQFEIEAQAAARVHHRSIVEIYDTVDVRGQAAIVMEFIEGRSLRDILDTHGKVTVRDALKIGVDLCEALAVLHETFIVHCDLKPANVIIGNRNRVVLADFGSAIQLNKRSRGRRGRSSTYRYAAPELLANRLIDRRADVYSLGVLLYELLSGQRPFDDKDDRSSALARLNRRAPQLATLAPEVPEAVRATIMRCLEREPDLRFDDTTQLAAALHAARARQGAATGAVNPATAPHTPTVMAPATNPTVPISRPAPSRRQPAAAGTAAPTPSIQQPAAFVPPPTPSIQQPAVTRPPSPATPDIEHPVVAPPPSTTPAPATPSVQPAAAFQPPAALQPPATLQPPMEPSGEGQAPVFQPITTVDPPAPSVAPGGPNPPSVPVVQTSAARTTPDVEAEIVGPGSAAEPDPASGLRGSAIPDWVAEARGPLRPHSAEATLAPPPEDSPVVEPPPASEPSQPVAAPTFAPADAPFVATETADDEGTADVHVATEGVPLDIPPPFDPFAWRRAMATPRDDGSADPFAWRASLAELDRSQVGPVEVGDADPAAAFQRTFAEPNSGVTGPAFGQTWNDIDTPMPPAPRPPGTATVPSIAGAPPANPATSTPHPAQINDGATSRDDVESSPATAAASAHPPASDLDLDLDTDSIPSTRPSRPDNTRGGGARHRATRQTPVSEDGAPIDTPPRIGGLVALLAFCLVGILVWIGVNDTGTSNDLADTDSSGQTTLSQASQQTNPQFDGGAMDDVESSGGADETRPDTTQPTSESAESATPTNAAPDDEPADGTVDSAEAAEGVTPRPPAEIALVRSFDPFGDGVEHDAELSNLTDGDVDTTWSSEVYGGPLEVAKPGLGIALKITGGEPPDALVISAAQAGWSAMVYASATSHDNLADWGDPISSIAVSDVGQTTIDLPDLLAGEADGTHVLVWFTSVPQSIASSELFGGGPGYQLKLGEVSLLGGGANPVAADAT